MSLLPIDKSFSQIAETTGSDTYDFLNQLQEAAKDYTCGLWNKYPNGMLGVVGLAGSFTRGYMNQACRDQNPPTEITPPPFTGGQCPIRYNVRVDVAAFPSSTNCDRSPSSVSFFNSGFWGPISDVSLQNPIGNCGGFRTLRIICHGVASQTRLNDPVTLNISEFNYGRFLNIQNLEITTIENVPDNCGDVGGGYPPDPDFDSNDLTKDYTVNNFDGTTTTIPVGLVVFNNDINGSLEMPININVGGINVSVDLGGISFNRQTTNNYNQTDGERLDNNEKHPLPTPDDEQEEEEELPPPNGVDFDTEVRPDASSGLYVTDSGLKYVTLNIIELPTNTSSRYGGVAPDVQYCGWFEWVSSVYKHPRTLVQFEENIFLPPDGITGYAYTLYEGCLGFSTEFYLLEAG